MGSMDLSKRLGRESEGKKFLEHVMWSWEVDMCEERASSYQLGVS